MNVIYEKKNKMTFIGYHTEINPEEAYQKCPEFWDKEYAAKYARLWQTMQPENAVEKAILDNGIHTGLPVCIRVMKCRRDWNCIPSRRAGGPYSQQEGRFQARCKY